MVEMLGVLMIIGVLSVASIFGYMKAMDKVDLNKQSQQLTSLLTGMITFFRTTGRVTYTENPMILMSKLGYVPDSMISPDNETEAVDVLRQSYYFVQWNGRSQVSTKYAIANVDACVNYYKTLQKFSPYVHRINDLTYEKIFWYGDRVCNTSSKPCLSTQTISDIHALCKTNCSNSCTIWTSLYRY